MYLSVPIPIRNEKLVYVILLPRIRKRDIHEDIAEPGGGEDTAADAAGGGKCPQSPSLSLIPCPLPSHSHSHSHTAESPTPTHGRYLAHEFLHLAVLRETD